MDQDLGRTLGATERAGDLAVVHVQGEAHDQRRLPVFGKGGDTGEDVAQLFTAFDELADWELAAMKNPRDWGRTGAAIVIGGSAAAALVLVRAQRRSKKQGHPLRSLEEATRDVTREIQKRLGR